MSEKTTTAAKLAKLLKEKYTKKVLLVSVDVYRPAAIKQLSILSQQIDVEFFYDESDKPDIIVNNAINHAKVHYFDVILLDTAGRLSIDTQMMDELKMLADLTKPVESLLVLDAMSGQDSVNVAKQFNELLGITGTICTKLDGDARGGAILSVSSVIKKPVKFIGTSEKLSGLEVFYPERIAKRILGLGDILSVIEDVETSIGKNKIKRIKKSKKI